MRQEIRVRFRFSDGRVVEAATGPEAALETPSGEELRGWTSELSRLAGRPAPTGPHGPVSTLGQAAQTLLDEMGWTERATVMLTDTEFKPNACKASCGKYGGCEFAANKGGQCLFTTAGVLKAGAKVGDVPEPVKAKPSKWNRGG